MNLEEYRAKRLLSQAGIKIPEGKVVTSAAQAEKAAAAIGPVAVKAQVAAGGRGKAGGIRLADTPGEARAAAERILGTEIAGYHVQRLLVEKRTTIAPELYASVLNDPNTKGPLVLFSDAGGVDVEALTVAKAGRICRIEVDIRDGLPRDLVVRQVAALAPAGSAETIADLLEALYGIYRETDAELIEVNPFGLDADGSVIALDCKYILDDSGLARHPDLVALGTPDPMTETESRAQTLGLKFIELEGEIGVLANGAGLTMATMDVIAAHGGRPANFLEIGGDSYTKAKPALELVLSNPRLKSLVANFCGAFARTDVMTAGVVEAWQELTPSVPIFFSVHGTGKDEAIELLRSELGVEPFPSMEEAIRAAVEAAA